MRHGWNKTQSFGIGFVLVNSEKGVVFAGARNGQADSSTEAELTGAGGGSKEVQKLRAVSPTGVLGLHCFGGAHSGG